MWCVFLFLFLFHACAVCVTSSQPLGGGPLGQRLALLSARGVRLATYRVSSAPPSAVRNLLYQCLLCADGRVSVPPSSLLFALRRAGRRSRGLTVRIRRSRHRTGPDTRSDRARRDTSIGRPGAEPSHKTA